MKGRVGTLALPRAASSLLLLLGPPKLPPLSRAFAGPRPSALALHFLTTREPQTPSL